MTPVNVPSTDLETGDILQQYMLPEYKRAVEANESAVSTLQTAVSTLQTKVPEAMFTAKLTSSGNVVDIQSSLNVSSATVVVTGGILANNSYHWWHLWKTTINFTSSINSGGFIYPYIYEAMYRGGFSADMYSKSVSSWISIENQPTYHESGNTFNSIVLSYYSQAIIGAIPPDAHIGLIVYGGPA